MKLLHIQVSPSQENSSSRKASKYLAERIKHFKPEIKETVLDLDSNPLPHLSGKTISAFFTPIDNQTQDQRDAILLSDKMVDQLFDTDTIIISTPMWNMGIPSVLKAWFDHVTRAGRTFAFTKEGTKLGLVKGKKVYIVISSGGLFTEGPFMADDQCLPYLKTGLAYIGIDDIELIRVEGTAMPGIAATALSKALSKIDQIVTA